MIWFIYFILNADRDDGFSNQVTEKCFVRRWILIWGEFLWNVEERGVIIRFFIFIRIKLTHLMFSRCQLSGLLFKNQPADEDEEDEEEEGGCSGCDWKIGSLSEWLAFTLMNLIWMEVHIKPHRFCTVILLIATEASLFVVLTPIQLKSHLEGNRLGSVNFMWKTPRD